MEDSDLLWSDRFQLLFQDSVIRFSDARGQYSDSFYTGREQQFLASIGYQPREMFDFVEDYVKEGALSPSTALLVAAVRRDYFLSVQHGVASTGQALVSKENLPAAWGEGYVSRIIAKAQGKLKGLLDPDIMYCCSGDRKFLREHGNIHPADFLRVVWATNGVEERVLEYIKSVEANNK
jgi:hypothetical protein